MKAEPSRLARAFVGLTCAVYAVVGIPFLVAPAEMTSLVGVSLTSITADNDVRAVYGGVATGLSIFLGLATRRAAWLAPALWVIVLTLGGLAFGRFVSLILVGMPEPLALALHAAELAGTAVAILVLQRLS